MSSSSVWILVLAIVAVLAFAGYTMFGVACSTTTTGPFVHRWDEVYTGNFAAGTVELNQSTGNGGIIYRTWSGPGYKLVMHMRALGITEAQARARAAEVIKVEHTGSGIKVDGDGGWFPKAAAEVELYLPAGPEYHVQAKASNGSVKLEGGRYPTARVTLGNGSFESTAEISDLEAKVGNGAIQIEAIGSGRWSLTSGAGSIKVSTANLGETGMMVAATAKSGTIIMEAGGQHREQRGAGNAPLQVATDGFEQARTQLLIQAHTGMGKITVLPNP